MDYKNDTLNNKEEGINVRRFVVKILENWPLFVLSIGISCLIAFLINRYTEPIYSSSATLVISDDKKTSAEMVMPTLDRYNTRKNVENEMAILKSFNISYNTISKLNLDISYYIIGHVRQPQLYNACPFYVVADSSGRNIENYPIYITILNSSEYHLEIDNQYKIDKVLKFGETFHHGSFNFTIFLNPNKEVLKGTKFFFVFNNLTALANQFRNSLYVSSNEKKGSLVTLTITSTVAQLAVDYLNKLCEVYIKTNLDEKNKASSNTIKFIDSQLENVSDSLRAAELKLQNFRVENKIIDLSMEGNSIFNNVNKLQDEKVQLQMHLNYYKYLKKYIEDRKDMREVIAPSTMDIEEGTLSKSIGDLIDLYSQRAVLSRSAEYNNPALNVLDIKIEKGLEALRENMNEIINSTILNISSIDARIKEVDQQMDKLPFTERKLINIQREYDLNSNIFNFLLQKRAEAGIAKASNVADSKVIDQALSENVYQISPKRSKNYMVALFVGLLIPLAIVFLLELFNTRITDLSELDRFTNCSILGSIGHNEKSSELPVFENPKSSLSESFRSLRTNLQYLLREKDQKVIVITSTVSGEGKTFCAVNLASILAMSNKRTLLVSLDLRKPKVHKLFNLTNETGLSTYLIKRDTQEEVIFQTNINQLFITTSGPVPPNPAELLETKEMEDFLEYAKNEFDYVVIDTPPVAIVTDALLLARHADATIFVVRQNYSSREVLQLADDLSQKAGIKHLSIVVNDVRVSGYYGYSYKYGYRYGYGYNYNYGYDSTYGSDYYDDPVKLTWKNKIKKYLKLS